MTNSVIADTNALFRLFGPQLPEHDDHRKALAGIRHLVISPLVLCELDYLLSRRAGARKAVTALRFIERHCATRRFEIPDIAPHMTSALAVQEDYLDIDQGRGVGLAAAMNVALAAAYHTDSLFSSDRHFRVLRPLTGHSAFRLLPEDA